jgi:pimeloyl-ACP methyl ester carboxylesterase/DNA-directed RNA polymerase subunit M/transcription elongation factor TFIIS
MSGIRFCSECLNILHPEEEKSEKRLLFVCKSCDYREYITDTTSMDENKIYQRDFTQSVTENFIDPDYCLDPTMPRENEICPLCRYTECAYLIEREPGDKFLRKIYVCGKIGKNGRPECKNVFTSVKYLKLQKGETYAYREFGTSPTVLLMLHGNLTSSYIFERTFGRLSPNFKVIAPDLRGFGLSSYASPVKSLDDFVDDLEAFMRELKITKFVLLGWDLGAAIALKFAASFPGLLEKLILVNPVGMTGKTFVADPTDENNPIPEWPDEIELIEKDKRVGDFVDSLRERKRDYLKRYYNEEIFSRTYLDGDILDAYIDKFIAQRNLVDIIASLIDYDVSEDGTNEIYKVQTDTLILCGKEDQKTPARDAVEIKKALGEIADIKIFDDVGHVLMEDDFGEFIDCVTNFCFEDRNM